MHASGAWVTPPSRHTRTLNLYALLTLPVGQALAIAACIQPSVVSIVAAQPLRAASVEG